MSADAFFWLTLAVKMATTGGLVVLSSVAAERAGPVLGALIATLPVSAGPTYVFLALDHDAAFIARSAIGSVAINAVTAIYALIYALAAQRQSMPVSLAAGLGVWAMLAVVVQRLDWSLGGAVALNVVVFAIGLLVAARVPRVPMPRIAIRPVDLVLRGAMSALLVGVVVAISRRVNPILIGTLAIFPVVFTSLILVLHNRVGARPTASVLASAITGLVGFGLGFVALALLAEHIGVWTSLIVTLVIQVGWNFGVWLVRHVAARRRLALR